VVKRGCAVEDKRYNGSGCEEQIAIPGKFTFHIVQIDHKNNFQVKNENFICKFMIFSVPTD